MEYDLFYMKIAGSNPKHTTSKLTSVKSAVQICYYIRCNFPNLLKHAESLAINDFLRIVLLHLFLFELSCFFCFLRLLEYHKFCLAKCIKTAHEISSKNSI